jgi:hypothetical protein
MEKKSTKVLETTKTEKNLHRPKLKKICRSSFKSVSFEILLKTRKNPKSPRAGPGFPGRVGLGPGWSRAEG